jgi:hypothetical protein
MIRTKAIRYVFFTLENKEKPCWKREVNGMRYVASQISLFVLETIWQG